MNGGSTYGEGHHTDPVIADVNETARVFLCDDQLDVRGALRDVIANLPGFTVTGEAATGAGCLEALQADPADLIVLDVNLPGGGPALAAALRQQHPTITMVVFTAHCHAQVEEAMRQAGADEYIVKTGRLAPLRSALLRHQRSSAEIATANGL